MNRDSIKRTTNKSSSRKGTQNEENKKSYKAFYQSSEGVIKQLLDKIINTAVRTSQAKIVDDQLGDFCFNNLKIQMTNFFQTNFINYTDDLPHEEPPILWEFIHPPENTWVELPEPGTQEMDRYESSNIAFLEIKKDQLQEVPTPTISKKNYNDINLNNKKGRKKESEPLSLNNNNIISEVEEKSSISGFDGELKIDNAVIPEYSGIEDKLSESLSITDAEIKKNIDKVSEVVQNEKSNKQENLEIISPKKDEIKENINKNDIKKEEKKDIINPSSPARITTALPPIKKKGKNIVIPDYPFTDIPGVEEEYNHDIFEPQNVEFLRREREELIQKKIIENKLKETANKTIKPTEDNDRIKKKLIDTNRLTFDSNGNIIQFRPYKLDNLMKDFAITKNIIRSPENKVEIISTTKKRKNKEKKEKEVLQEEIIKNEEEKKVKEVNNITNSLNTEREKFIPSGSNFQIISPNYGVVIKENNQLKEGPRDFSKYFKKYSLQDYDKMLSDYVPLQNRTMLQNHLNSSINNSKYLSTTPNKSKLNPLLSKKSSNINPLDSNNNVNLTEIPINPLLSNEDQSSYSIDKDKSINNSNLGSNINSNIGLNNPLLSSNINSMNFNKYNESNNSLTLDNNSIVMKKLGLGSLKLELESLKDLSLINPDLVNNIPSKRKNILGSNLFRSNKSYRIKQNPIKNYLNDFNKKIMITSGWGNDTGEMSQYKDKNNVVYSRHMTKQQVLRELGSNILSGIKIRLPRDRKVDINNNI